MPPVHPEDNVEEGMEGRSSAQSEDHADPPTPNNDLHAEVNEVHAIPAGGDEDSSEEEMIVVEQPLMHLNREEINANQYLNLEMPCAENQFALRLRLVPAPLPTGVNVHIKDLDPTGTFEIPMTPGAFGWVDGMIYKPPRRDPSPDADGGAGAGTGIGCA